MSIDFPNGQSRKIAAVIVAAGRGIRASGTGMPDLPKQYQRVGGEVVLARTIGCFLDHALISHIVVVIGSGDRGLYDAAAPDSPRLLDPAVGGATRQESVFSGLKALLPDPPDFVLIHDGARPFLSKTVIDEAIDALERHPAVVSGLPIFDTVKRIRPDGTISETVDRTPLRTVQTPQGFHFPLIVAAHEKAREAGRSDFTDDAAVAEFAGQSVLVAPGSPENVKLTTAADFAAAEERLAMQDAARRTEKAVFETRIGTGFDVHAFEPGDGVILGGITIPFDRRLKGHSDADVALHTITDAIYGALADGDIGHHFPPADPQWKGKDSAYFLRHAVGRVAERGGRIDNVDLTVICEAPKVGPHRDAMRANIAALMSLDLSRVSVKATTTERLGFTGRQEGIAAQASVAISLPAGDDDAVHPEERPYSADLIERASRFVARCAERGLMVATAESCTGGLIAGLLTSVAGSSAVVDRGFVTYSNAAKTEMIGVPSEVIDRVGAVSEEVARAMAQGALDNSDADLSVAVTGIAGPSGGSADKSVGLVHFAAASKGGEVRHERIVFPDSGRTGIRRATVEQALAMLEELMAARSTGP